MCQDLSRVADLARTGRVAALSAAAERLHRACGMPLNHPILVAAMRAARAEAQRFRASGFQHEGADLAEFLAAVERLLDQPVAAFGPEGMRALEHHGAGNGATSLRGAAQGVDDGARGAAARAVRASSELPAVMAAIQARVSRASRLAGIVGGSDPCLTSASGAPHPLCDL